MSKVPDDADRAKAGTLPRDPAADAERARLRVVKPNERPRTTEPAALDAEDALLGALLWAGKNQPGILRVTSVVDILETGEPFWQRGHGAVFEAMKACTAESHEHDPVAVLSQMARSGTQGSVNRETLEKLVDGASTVSERQARVYATEIRDAWARRTVIADARKLMEDARNPKTTTAALVEQARVAISQASARTATATSSVSIHKSAEMLFAKLQAGLNTAMPTGLGALDAAINGGLRPGEVSILAARPAIGKSVCASQIAEHIVSADASRAALYVTLEMTHEQFTARLIAARSGVPMSNLRRMVLNPTQWQGVTEAVRVLSQRGLYFTDSTTQTLASIYATAAQRARVLAREGKRLVLVVVDHVSLVKPSAEAIKRSNREQQVAETSRGLRFIANELGCHVMGIAHISREGEKESGNRMPQMRALRESGSLENDADLVMIMHRERDPDTGLLNNEKPAALAVAKARLDETAILLLNYDGARARFADWTGDGTYATFYGKDR